MYCCINLCSIRHKRLRIFVDYFKKIEKSIIKTICEAATASKCALLWQCYSENSKQLIDMKHKILRVHQKVDP